MPDPVFPNNPSQGPQDKSMEIRLLLAFILMGAVLFFTPYFYKPSTTPPPKTDAPQTAAAPKPAATPAAPAPATIAPASSAPAASTKEETVTIETDLFRVRFSNRGAVVTSWILKGFKDTAGQPLELVPLRAVPRIGYPLAAWLNSGESPKPLTEGLYVAKVRADGLAVDFEYADAEVRASKSFVFEKNKYLSRVTSEVFVKGVSAPHKLVWRGGFGDHAAYSSHATQHALYFNPADNKLVLNDASAGKGGAVIASGSFTFAGLEDAYFAAVFLPLRPTPYQIATFSTPVPLADGKSEEPHVGAGIGGDARNEFQLFVGPKDIDILRAVDRRLENLVDWGWFWFLAKPLFSALHWTHDKYFPNWGWAIVVLTIVINLLLIPLKLSNLKSMKQMQVIQPEVQKIRDKYKGLGLRDPKKQQENQELMELYKKHNVNLAGGCLPMLLQIPFFIGFYKVLTVAIELRGAPWLWISDLSQPETLPIRMLPVAMIASQFVLQKMTPATPGADPTQQKMMMFMPLMFGFMFYGVSSGLLVYWVTGNLVGILQQWFFNRTVLKPAAVAVRTAAPQKGKK